MFDEIDSNYEELKKKIFYGLNLPSVLYESTPSSLPNYYETLFNEAVSKKNQELEDKMSELVQKILDLSEEHKRQKKKKHRSIDDPFEPSVEQ